MALVLFPSHAMNPREVDEDFADERRAAQAAGLSVALLDHTRAVQGDAGLATARVPEGAGTVCYRGWMLRPGQYVAVFEALAARGVTLINDPQAYRTCHYLPDSYRFIEGHTPRSVWLSGQGAPDRSALAEALAPLADGPAVLKDYVKSQKHYWTEACFIPSTRDLDAVERVVRRFLELQADDLNEGLVFREYVPLKLVGQHPKSKLPLAAEFRIFWLGREPLLCHRYWGDLTTFDAPLPLDELRPIVARIPSRFFTMDVALREGGGWTIVELGDGQVAGLPSLELASQFYSDLAKRLG